MIKKFFVLFFLPLALFGDNSLIAKLMEAGKPYDLGLTLVAIVEEESGFGRYKVNLQDPSCGLTMIHLKYFLVRNKIADNDFNRNKACQDLINDDELAIAEAIAVLMFWKNKFCNQWGCSSKQWLNVWSAYNGGYNYKSKKAREYANRIKNRISSLKKKMRRVV